MWIFIALDNGGLGDCFSIELHSASPMGACEHTTVWDFKIAICMLYLVACIQYLYSSFCFVDSIIVCSHSLMWLLVPQLG